MWPRDCGVCVLGVRAFPWSAASPFSAPPVLRLASFVSRAAARPGNAQQRDACVLQIDDYRTPLLCQQRWSFAALARLHGERSAFNGAQKRAQRAVDKAHVVRNAAAAAAVAPVCVVAVRYPDKRGRTRRTGQSSVCI